MAWNEAAVTNGGLELLSKCVLGGGVEITAAVGGENVSPAASLLALKEIEAPVHAMQTAEAERMENGVRVNVRVQNNGLTESYRLRQIGLYARLSESGEKPILLAVIQDRDGEEVPTEEENPEYLLEYDFVIPLSNTENITVSVTPNTFATLGDLKAANGHIEDNVRHITAEERTKWNAKAEAAHTHSAVTQSANGFMSAADKIKLDGISAGANAYTLPLATASVRGGAKIGYAANGKNYPVQLSNEQMYVNVPWTDTNTTYANMTGATTTAAGKAGLVPAPALGAATRYLRSDGTWQVPPDNNTTYSNMTAATASAAGKAGLVPAPAAGAQAKFLRGDGTWQTPPDTNTTYSNMTGATTTAAGKAGLVPAPALGAATRYLRSDGTWQVPPNTTYSAATASAAGLMSAADKTKLDGISAGANAYTHPAYTARTGVPTANATPAFGSTFSVTQPVSDSTGHITAMTTRTVKIPSTAATVSAAGLMSAADKSKLDGVKLSGINATYGTAARTVGTTTVSVPHKVDLLIAWVPEYANSSPNAAFMNSSCSSGKVVNTTVTLSVSASSASISFNSIQAFSGPVYYAAFQLS